MENKFEIKEFISPHYNVSSNKGKKYALHLYFSYETNSEINKIDNDNDNENYTRVTNNLINKFQNNDNNNEVKNIE